MQNDFDLASVIWQELKEYISKAEQAEAADTLVSILIDHNNNPEDIRAAFKNDSDVKLALTGYLDDEEVEEDVEDYDDYSEDDEDY